MRQVNGRYTEVRDGPIHNDMSGLSVWFSRLWSVSFRLEKKIM